MRDMLEIAKEREKLCGEVKNMIVEQLSLDMEADFITNDQPIFGRGLELDSIDALELAIGLFEYFSIALTDEGTGIFTCVNTMADYIMERKSEEETE